MMYTVNDLYDGMELVCENTVGVPWWTTGKIYTVNKSFVAETIKKCGKYFIIDDSGDKRDTSLTILDGLNNPDAPVKFTEIKEEKEEEETMAKRLEIKVGQVFQCVSSNVEWWTSGKNYNVVLFNGAVGIMDEDHDHHRVGVVGSDSIQIGTAQFKLHKVEEEVPYIECVNTHGVSFWTKGKKYPITKIDDGFVIYDDEGDVRDDESPSALLEQLKSNSRASFILHLPNSKVPEIDVVRGCIDQLDGRLDIVNARREQLIAERDKLDAQINELNKEKGDLSNTKTLLIKFENNKNK